VVYRLGVYFVGMVLAAGLVWSMAAVRGRQ
jgi:hypothetical protein